MQGSFDIIKRSRALLNAVPKSTATETTAASYRAQMDNLLKSADTSAEIIKAAQRTTKVSVWFSRRAAITFSSRETIERMLQVQDQEQRQLKNVPSGDPRWQTWKQYVRAIGKWSIVLAAIQTASSLPEELRTNRHSKRTDIKKLPQDWRERIVDRMPNYRLAVLTAAACGCRPAEIAKGIELSIENGKLVALIRGSKTSDVSGQPWRRLSWPVSGQPALLRALIEEVTRSGGRCTAKIDSPKNFHSAVRSAGRREWPDLRIAVTPYCFRHALAADMKVSGLPADQISAGLGHCVDVTKSRYGHAKMGGHRGLSPTNVEAARPVKKIAGATRAFLRSKNGGEKMRL